MAVVLGLSVALAYGIGDFFGGIASKRNATAAVVLVSQAFGLAALLVVVGPLGGEPSARDLVLGAGAGSVGLVALLLLYRGLATGSMSVVAPVTAVGAAVVPLAWGLGTGERPSPVALAGVLAALVAVVLVAGASPPEEDVAPPGTGPRAHRRELGLALGAGAGFGAVFILFAETGDGSGMWPLVAARVASVGVTGAAFAALRRRPVIAQGDRLVVAAAGLLDVGANALFVVAARHGLLSLVSVLASLYPASTVVLARVVLAERLTARQVGGLGLALLGVGLITAG